MSHRGWERVPEPFIGYTGTGYKTVPLAEVRESDATHIPKHKRRSFSQRWLGGLKFSLRGWTFLVFLILVVNIAIFVWAQRRFGVSSGYVTLQEGECSGVKRLDTYLHLCINIFSTLVLMGSNTFLQTYSAPSRREVDAAHQRRKWLHIGVLSPRNLGGISKRKAFVCLVLAFSSIPFHLLYNSLVFSSLNANEYRLGIVTETFFTGASWNLSSSDAGTYDPEDPADRDWQIIQQHAAGYARLSNADCIRTYSEPFQSQYRTVLLVSSLQNDTNSILYFNEIGKSLSYYIWDLWICSKIQSDPSDACNPDPVLANAANWQVYGRPIEYCMAEQTDEICALQFSFGIMLAVLVCNMLKFVSMMYVLFRFDASSLLVSTGDAIASFITLEDPTTHGMCLADRKNLYSFWRAPGPRPYTIRQGRWWRAASKKRWIAFTFLMLLALAIILILQIWGLSDLSSKQINPYGIVLGSLNVNALVFADNGISTVGMALLANTPQFLLSLISLAYSNLLTSMYLAADFASLAFKPATLMVSTPVGEQRGTWLMGIPFFPGLANMLLQIALHFFVSQSIFAVSITVRDIYGNPDMSTGVQSAYLANCGYSPIAIWVAFGGGVVILLSAYGMGLKRFKKGGPPVVGTCSAAISAGCHPRACGPGQGERISYGECRWAAGGGMGVGEVGHCSIEEEEAWDKGIVGRAVEGRWYAGKKKL